MKLFIKSIFSLIAIFHITSVLACSCAQIPFLQLVELGNTDNIIRLRVLRHEIVDEGISSYMEGEVLQQWRGAIESNEIRIYGGDGLACLPFVMEFDIGNEWLLPLTEIQGGYRLSTCTTPLLIEDGSVTGLISPLRCSGDPQSENHCGYLSPEEYQQAQSEQTALEEFTYALELYSDAVTWTLRTCEGPWSRCSEVRANFDPQSGELVLPSIDVLATPFTYGVSAKMKLLAGSPITFELTEVD